MKLIFGKIMAAVVALTLLIGLGVVLSAPASAATRSCSTKTAVSKRPTLYPGDKGSCVNVAQARLIALGYMATANNTGTFASRTKSAVQRFQAVHKISRTGNIGPKTWRALYAQGVKQAPLPRACTYKVKRSLCISKSERLVREVYKGQIRIILDSRFGADRTPTRNGTYRLYWKSRNHVSSLYHTAMPYAMFFSGGQAVHYSSDFAKRGYSGRSHGCVNVRDKTRIRQLFDRTPTGTRVVVY